MSKWQLWFMFKAWVLDNKIAIGLLITAGVKTLPTPGQPFKPYVYFYDWSHQYLNLPNLRLTATPVIAPPATDPALNSGQVQPGFNKP